MEMAPGLRSPTVAGAGTVPVPPLGALAS